MNPTRMYTQERVSQISKNLTDVGLDTATNFYTEHLVRTNFVKNFTWMGRPILQYPTDMFTIAELIWQIRPDYIIETGMAHGGGLIFYATILEALQNGRVISIELDPWQYNVDAIESHYLQHRIDLIKGSSVDRDLIYARVRPRVENHSVLVILDSHHTHSHVLRELTLYSPFVSKDSYIVVMDTAIEFYGHLDKNQDRPWSKGNNPWTAVQSFLKGNKDFVADKAVEQVALITAAPGGWLRRI